MITPIIEIFDKVGTSSWVCPAGIDMVRVLVVGGGGGGASWVYGGGGGGGGVVDISGVAVVPGTPYTVTVGDGGAGGASGGGTGGNGSVSVFGTITAYGGGGGAYGGSNGMSGACGGGGGGGFHTTAGGLGMSGQGVNGIGYAGGAGYDCFLCPPVGGGGGGAGTSGLNGIAGSQGGSGGFGMTSDIMSGTQTYGGGGGGYCGYHGGAGGAGGGGHGGSSSALYPNTDIRPTFYGGGAGAGGYPETFIGSKSVGASGYQGIVVLSYGSSQTIEGNFAVVFGYCLDPVDGLGADGSGIPISGATITIGGQAPVTTDAAGYYSAFCSSDFNNPTTPFIVWAPHMSTIEDAMEIPVNTSNEVIIFMTPTWGARGAGSGGGARTRRSGGTFRNPLNMLRGLKMKIK